MRVEVDGGAVEVRVRFSQRAKRLRITVGPHHPAQVVVPAGTSMSTVRSFLDDTREWIGRQAAQAEAAANRPSVLGLEAEGVVWVAGRPISVRRELAGRASARLATAETLVVSGPPDRHAAAIARWYRREARRRLTLSVREEAARLCLSWASIGVRDPRTRWGSCSHRGHLSFSWRLVLAPPGILRYVVIHELCHLVEHNHSKAYWRTLDAAEPGWRDSAGWLRTYGHELHRYDPASALPASTPPRRPAERGGWGARTPPGSRSA
jgi:predicted metal-dependent hydrolase